MLRADSGHRRLNVQRAIALAGLFLDVFDDVFVFLEDSVGLILVSFGDGAPIERFERHVRLLDAQGLGFRGQTQRLRVEQFDLPSGASGPSKRFFRYSRIDSSGMPVAARHAMVVSDSMSLSE